MPYDHIIQKGSTSQILELTLRDSSSGQGKTAVLRTSVTCTYLRRGAGAHVPVSLFDMIPGTWISGGWVEVHNMDRPGEYAFGIPDAAIADGADGVTFRFKAAGVIDKEVKVQLVAANLQAAAVPANVTQIASSTPAGTALRNMMIGDVRSTLYLGKLDIQATGNAVDIAGGGAGYGINITAGGTALRVVSTSTIQPAAYVQGGGAAVPALALQGGNGGGIGFQIAGGSGGYGLKLDGARAYLMPDDTSLPAVKAVTDHLATALELDGAVYRFTANALEMAPSGGGAVADWTADERAQIRSALGVTGTQAPAAAGGQLQTIAAAIPTFPANFASLAITASGAVTAGTVQDKTGYTLAQAFPANFASLSITAGGQVTLSAAAIDAIWDEVLTAGHAVAGSAAVLLGKLNVSGTLAHTDNAASFKADVSGLLTAAQFNTKIPQNIPFVNGKVDANATATATVDNAAIADAVWDEALSGHQAAGSAGAALAAGGGGGGSSTGDGDTECDANTGGVDNLRYTAADGTGIDAATVTAYLKSDYDAGIYLRRAVTRTRADGRWVDRLKLNSGLTYAILFELDGVCGPDRKDVTIP